WETTAAIDGKRPQASATAFIIQNQGRFFLLNERGEFIISNLNESGYHEIDRVKIIQPTNTAFGRKVVWSSPAFANRKGFFRNDEEIICVELAQ
ncbi:MAG: pyrrolo-quinoline quinone, partial [Planctomycetota bacterium]|nr:pyrrolo-quinoline quinone [Planctomycetota bacterium]